MRAFLLSAALATSLIGGSVVAQTTATTAPAAKTTYSTDTTDIGTLLDDPAARAILDKHMPGFSANEQIDMARSMTLKAIQQYSSDTITDQVLAAIDTDLAQLPAKQ